MYSSNIQDISFFLKKNIHDILFASKKDEQDKCSTGIELLALAAPDLN